MGARLNGIQEVTGSIPVRSNTPLTRQHLSDFRRLVIEFVLPPGDEPFFGKWLDLHMLVMARGARERTAAEYEALFKRARLALARVGPTALGLSVVEAAPV